MSAGPKVAAYMLSLLRRRAGVDPLPFAGADQGHWLVCESGSSSRSGGLDLTREPLLAERAASARDALTFHLPRRAEVKLGRSNLCDILINDSTVSREHLLFCPERREGWLVKVLSASGSTEVDGAELQAGEGMRLEGESRIRVGDVRLIFLDAQAFLRRLKQG